MMHATLRLMALLVGAAWAAGCVTVAASVSADEKSALEQQASGSFKTLGAELDQASVSARPVPYTRGQMEAAGVPVGKGDEALAEDDATSDGDLLDQLLVRRCLGEALDGTLVDTATTCTAPIAPAQQARLLERENRRRWQLWRALQTGKSSKAGAEPTVEAVQKAWRTVHLGEVICGGQVQATGGTWEVKKC